MSTLKNLTKHLLGAAFLMTVAAAPAHAAGTMFLGVGDEDGATLAYRYDVPFTSYTLGAGVSLEYVESVTLMADVRGQNIELTLEEQIYSYNVWLGKDWSFLGNKLNLSIIGGLVEKFNPDELGQFSSPTVPRSANKEDYDPNLGLFLGYSFLGFGVGVRWTEDSLIAGVSFPL